jgi:hypothetical protein
MVMSIARAGENTIVAAAEITIGLIEATDHRGEAAVNGAKRKTVLATTTENATVTESVSAIAIATARKHVIIGTGGRVRRAVPPAAAGKRNVSLGHLAGPCVNRPGATETLCPAAVPENPCHPETWAIAGTGVTVHREGEMKCRSWAATTC